VFQTTLNGEELPFLLQDCKPSRLEMPRLRLRRELMLEPEFHPLAFCLERSRDRRGDLLALGLLLRVLGSGGGRQDGGRCRSSDGRGWQRLGAPP
jgi:hypothetical protein